MRILFGIFIGIFLTIGAAYVHDSSRPPAAVPPAGAPVSDGRIVNWDVLDAVTHEQTEALQQQWDRIVH